MNDIHRIGGWSAILYGIAFLVAFGLFIPTYAAMPPEALEPGNDAALLTAFDSLGSAQRAALAIGFALQMVAPVLMFPAVLAVYAATKEKSEARAGLAVGMAALGIPFFMLLFSSDFTLLELSEGFGTADPVAQAARAAAWGAAGNFGLYSERVFHLFFVWAAILWFGLMRDTVFPRWVPSVGLAAALVGVIGAVGGMVVPTLEFVLPLAQLILIVWFVGLGVSLLRSGRGPG